MLVHITTDIIDVAQHYAEFARQNSQVGAVAMFAGRVRGDEQDSLTLEHYPNMTEKQLSNILQRAEERFSLLDGLVIHRIGRMTPTEDIVLVLAAAKHRHHAIHAVDFIMDYLKTEATFWKKEVIQGQSQWVDARSSDTIAKNRWT